MNAGAKLGAYGVVLAAAFTLGALLGDAVGPIAIGDDAVEAPVEPIDDAPPAHGGGHG